VLERARSALGGAADEGVKLALLGPAPPLRGGIAAYLVLLHRELERAGHEVTFIGFRKQYPERIPNLPILRKLRFPGSNQYASEPPAAPVPHRPLFVPWNPWSWWRTAQAVRQSGAQALVLKWWVPFFGPGYFAVGWLLRHLGRRVKVIAILDNVVPHERWPLGRTITRLGLGQMDAFIPQSKAVENELHGILPRVRPAQVRLVPHPTYDFTAEPPPDRDAARRDLGIAESRVGLFFGFIKPYKGLMVLLEALPHVLAELGPDFRLLVVGDFYEDSEPYRRRIAELGIADRMTLMAGYVEDADIPRYFIAADVVILPYLSATQSGIVQIAYRYDRPVVTTNVGGLPEFVDEGSTGFMVPPGDPQALARAVVRFFREADPQKMAAAIARRRQETSWDRLVAAIAALAAELPHVR
jgi:glycosyltransferase involved in cell wall biosynthesis